MWKKAVLSPKVFSMSKKNKKSDFIKVDELYFGKVGHNIKNRFLKRIVDLIFSDKTRKKKFNYGFFSMTFLGTDVEWYSNFMNGFFRKAVNVRCFFTKNNDSFIVYPVLGSTLATSFYSIPRGIEGYVAERKNVWQGENKKWKLEESSMEKRQEGKQYILEYQGEYKNKDGDYKVFEHTVFKGTDKVVFQAFVLKGGDQKVMSDIEKIAHSIEIMDK